MPIEPFDLHARVPATGQMRLDTLVRLRWLAVAGQSAAVVGVSSGLGYALPLGACFTVVAAAAVLNLVLRLRHPVNERLDMWRAAALLGFDIMQLAALLYLTGGLENPFAIMFLAPVLISATALPPVPTAVLGALAVACASFLAVFHLPLPWSSLGGPGLPWIYVAGVWTAIMLSVCFIGVYAWWVAEEARQLSDALAATELVLAREQHLSALDGLAAAAAHELGTPLATIALVVKELDRSIGADSDLKEDVVLLSEQVERCRTILRRLTTLDEGGAPHERMTLGHLLDEIAAPHRHFGIELVIDVTGDGESEPIVQRNPGLLYGLGNLVENAVDFARSRVNVAARFDREHVEVTITDDGPGFPPEVQTRLGDPYVTSRPQRRAEGEQTGAGLGLGVFIAKTLLERSGAEVTFRNVEPPSTGAQVEIIWPRTALAIEKDGV